MSAPAKIIAHDADIAHANVLHGTDKPEPLAICGSISSIDALNYRRTSKLPEHLKFYFFIFLCQCGHEENRTVVLNIY